MSVLRWAQSSLSQLMGISFDPNYKYLYVCNLNRPISKIKIADISVNFSWMNTAANMTYSHSITIDPTNTYGYISNNGNATISRVLMSDPTTITNAWCNLTGAGTGTQSLVIDASGTYMYATMGNQIHKITMTSASSVPAGNKNSMWSTGPPNLNYMIIDNTNTYLYAIGKAAIYKITISDGTVVSFPLTGRPLNNAYQGVLDPANKYMYVTNNGDSTTGEIIQINMATRTSVVYTPVSFGLNKPQGIAIDPYYTNCLYVGSFEGAANGCYISKILLPPTSLNTYYHTFYTVKAASPNILTRTIHDNNGVLRATQDISFGGMSISSVLSILDGGGTNPYTIGAVDSSQNKICMDLAFCNVYTTSFTDTQKTILISNVNNYIEPHTAAPITLYTVTVSGGVYWVAVNAATAVAKPYLTMTAGNVYVFDQSDSTNFGNLITLGKIPDSLVPYLNGVVINGTPGSKNAYTLIDITATSPFLYYYSTTTSGMGDNI